MHRDLYPGLIETNREAFAAGHYETAYHALMAALHAAADLRDVERLTAVAVLAQQQQQELDQLAPSHALASKRTRRRGQPGSYSEAARQAEAQARLVEGGQEGALGTRMSARKVDVPKRVPRPGQGGTPDRPREARLRPGASHLYPGIDVAAWVPAATMAEMVWLNRLPFGAPSPTDRALNPEHFQFRYGTAAERRRADAGRRATDFQQAHE
jgi:hypothetical protein